MLELDVQDILSLSDMKIFQPIAIKKVRLRQGKQYYEIEWKNYNLPSTQTLDEQINNLSLMTVNDDDDDELITIEPDDLFRHAYPDIVNAFETPILKPKKPPSSVKKKKVKSSTATAAAAASTSMSLDLLSMMQDDTICDVPINKKPICKFNHRPTMAALSTSMNIDVLGVLERSNGNINALRKAKSRPIKHKARSDMIVHSKLISYELSYT